MKKLLKISVILCSLSLLAGWVNVKASEPSYEVHNAELELTKRQVSVKVNDTIDPHSLVVSGVYDSIEYPVIDTSEVGSKYLVYKVTKGRSQVTKVIEINVTDHEGPIIYGEAELELRFESEFDITTAYEAIDEIDGFVEVEIDGEIDRSTPGEYEIYIVAVDSSNNETRKEVTIIILEDPEVVARNERNQEYKGLVNEALNLNQALLANTSVTEIENMLYRVNQALNYDSDYDTELSSLSNELTAKLQRAQAFYEPVDVITPTTPNPTPAPTPAPAPESSSQWNVTLTRYGMDCVGCRVVNGVAHTSHGIALTSNSVRQPDGTWQQGITYNGRYIFAGNSSHTKCTLLTLYDHPYEGMGITQGQPIYGIMADNGGFGYNHLDLFVGTETNLNAVYIANAGARPYAVITGFATFTGSGCSW